MRLLERNVFSLLERTARGAARDEPAFGCEGQTRTYGQLHARALAVARGLSSHGVRPGDRVAVLLSNRLEWPEVFFGLAAMGAVCVPINVLSTRSEAEHVCRTSDATVLVTDEVGRKLGLEAAVGFDLIVDVGAEDIGENRLGAAMVEYEDLLARAPETIELVGPDLSDTFILYFSSGTTGLPKAAEHTHNGVLWNAIGQIVDLKLTAEVRYAVVPSFSWAAGFHNFVLALVWLGGYNEIRPLGGASIDSIVDFIGRHDITHVMLVPSLLRGLIDRPDLMAALNASTLEFVITGAEPVPRTIVESCAAQMPEVAVCQGWGQSEFPTIGTLLRPEEVASHHGSAGRAFGFADIVVQRDDGVIATSGRGELLMRSPATMRGYFQQPEQTEAAFAQGWLHTGDLGEIDEEGFVTIVGRTKDMIISGGLNVYPKEIEDVIQRLPGIREVAVVGVQDPRFGESAVAVVVTDDPGYEVDRIHRAAEEYLASYKRPREVLVRTEPLPRSANSKILKREVRPWVDEVLARKSHV